MVDLNNKENMRDLLTQVVALSVEAGNAIMEIYNGPAFQVTHKEDKSPLDRGRPRLPSHHRCGPGKAHARMAGALGGIRDTPYETRSQWPVFWLVDPLDGTKELSSATASSP